VVILWKVWKNHFNVPILALPASLSTHWVRQW